MANGVSKFGPSVERDETLTAWLRAAAIAAAQIGAAKDARLLDWADGLVDEGATAEQAIERLRELPRVLFDDDLVELNHAVTLAAYLRGAVSSQRSAISQKYKRKNDAATRRHGDAEIANSEPDDDSIIIANAAVDIVGKLPFEEAIQGLAKRLGLIKWARSDRRDAGPTQERLPAFMELDAANRSRAFTMAWIEDLDHVEQVHQELVKTIAAGETLYDWRMKHIRDISEGGYRSTGWEGSPLGEAHYQLVYRQNLSMAYTAGRFEQGTRSGFRVVRILPTLSMSHRAAHDAYVGKLYRIDEQSMLPPWDFGCNHGWEWVFPEELERMGIDPDSLPLLRFDDRNQDFQWRPAAYMQLSIQPGQYTGEVRDIAEGMSSN